MQLRHRLLMFAGAIVAAIALCLPWKMIFGPAGSSLAPAPPSDAAPAERASDSGVTQSLTPAPTNSAPVSIAVSELGAEDRHKLDVLNEILRTENDNDPRIDSELKNLRGLKSVMRQEYAATPAEKRNTRGTIVYLIGREIESTSDISFLSQVLSEAPCLSMQDCRQAPPASADADATTGMDVGLAYPQIVAIKSLESYLEKGAPTGGKNAALDALARGRQSDNPRVSEWARKSLEKFSR